MLRPSSYVSFKYFIMNNSRKKIVVIGGGFAGINLVKALANDSRFEVTLVDRDNYHSFSPLLYQVGMAFIEPSNISYPFRRMFQGKRNLRFHLGDLVSVDVDNKTVLTNTGTLHYDSLVLAVGTESNYFGMENVKMNSLPLKTIADATNLRNHLLLVMEKAVNTKDWIERQSLLNVVITGAGPSGVEIAGMLAELASSIVSKEYPEMQGIKPSIYLVEAASVVLGPMSKRSQEEAYRVLNKLGVKVLLNTAVKDYVDGKVVFESGDSIATQSLIWTSGVTGREIPGLPSLTIGRGRRVLVNKFLRVKGLNDVYAIGDIALQTSDEKYPNGHPQLAQVAIQQGLALARNLKRQEGGEEVAAFRYYNKGTMAIISKYHAVVDLPKIFIKGTLAWIAWLLIHLIPIAGFRNKLALSLNWMWSFFTNDPTLRLIIRPKLRGSLE
jgi:NADH dehydrogenase